jgi:guanylate kinase
MTHWDEFDHVIVNADFATALGELAAIVGGRDDLRRTADEAVRVEVRSILASQPAD